MGIERVAQIFITDDDDDALPPLLEQAVLSVRRTFPNAHYRRHGAASLRDFIATHYEPDVLWAFDTLAPYAYKADLGRYCVLYAEGGWYFDIGLTVILDPQIREYVDLVMFRDIQRHTNTGWACTTAALYSSAGNPVLRAAIDLIVQNCRERYYGVTPLCPTGPSLFGQVLAAHRGSNRWQWGDFMVLTPEHRQLNLAYVLDDGPIVAWAKAAAGGDLTALGARGVNNYNEFWVARRAYGER